MIFFLSSFVFCASFLDASRSLICLPSHPAFNASFVARSRFQVVYGKTCRCSRDVKCICNEGHSHAGQLFRFHTHTRTTTRVRRGRAVDRTRPRAQRWPEVWCGVCHWKKPRSDLASIRMITPSPNFQTSWQMAHHSEASHAAVSLLTPRRHVGPAVCCITYCVGVVGGWSSGITIRC